MLLNPFFTNIADLSQKTKKKALITVLYCSYLSVDFVKHFTASFSLNLFRKLDLEMPLHKNVFHSVAQF